MSLFEFAHFSYYLKVTSLLTSIYNTHLLKKLHNTDCEFDFIARNFFSIKFTFLFICFYCDLKHTDHTISDRFLKCIRTRTYPVQCRHDLKVYLFVRSENYTQVCDQEFQRARKIS